MIKSSQSVTFKNVIPEHIKDNYPKFVEFLQVYYSHLSNENSPSWLIENLSDNLDIDNATDTFLLLLKNEIGLVLPSDAQVDRRLFLKHIREIYASKGSQQSIESLFRLIYGISCDVIYPSEQMLRASSGKWTKQISIRTQLISGLPLGDPSILAGHMMTGQTSGAYAVVEHVEFFNYLNYAVYELFFNVSDLSGAFVPFENVIVDGVTFNVYPVFSKVSVTSQGTGYNAGTKLSITNPAYAGVGGRCYIDVVGLVGDIKSIAITDFGVNIIPDTVTTLTITDVTLSDIVIPLYTYFVDLSGFGDGLATAKVTVGGMCFYRGRFSDTTGMPSGFDRIQDSAYYQTFSYIIKSVISFDSYKGNMQITHPAGYRMYGEVLLSTDVSNATTSILSPAITSRLTVA